MGVPVYWDLSALCVFVCVCLCVCVFVRSNQSTSKKPHYVSDLSKLIVCTHPLSAGGGGGGGDGGGGVEPPIKFSKRGGLDRISIFRGGLLGKRG